MKKFPPTLSRWLLLLRIDFLFSVEVFLPVVWCSKTCLQLQSIHLVLTVYNATILNKFVYEVERNAQKRREWLGLKKKRKKKNCHSQNCSCKSPSQPPILFTSMKDLLFDVLVWISSSISVHLINGWVSYLTISGRESSSCIFILCETRLYICCKVIKALGFRLSLLAVSSLAFYFILFFSPKTSDCWSKDKCSPLAFASS